MARQKKPDQRNIDQYNHENQQRVNNPPVGLVTPESDPDGDNKNYSYDPHLDPQLVWAGKAEHTNFEVPTVSLHVHERIDPRSIIEAVRKQNQTPPGSIPSPRYRPRLTPEIPWLGGSNLNAIRFRFLEFSPYSPGYFKR